MIELLLQAERTLNIGLLDQAERLYGQAVEADPQNAIAVVGLARVAVERGDERRSWELAVRALGMDPENGAAIRLEARMAEILATRGEPLARPTWVVENERDWRRRGRAELAAAAAAAPRPAPPIAVYPAEPGSGAALAAEAMSEPPTVPASEAPRKRGLLARLLGR